MWFVFTKTAAGVQNIQIKTALDTHNMMYVMTHGLNKDSVYHIVHRNIQTRIRVYMSGEKIGKLMV